MHFAPFLVQCRIRTVTLESTGVYWIPLFQIPDTGGLGVYLVNVASIGFTITWKTAGTANVRGSRTRHHALWVGLSVGVIHGKLRLFTSLNRFMGAPLITSTVKNVENICAAARTAIID
jgi:hypothetical protein